MVALVIVGCLAVVTLIALVIIGVAIKRFADPTLEPVTLPPVVVPTGSGHLALDEMLFDADGTGSFDLYVLHLVS